MGPQDLSGCTSVTDAGINAISSRCPNLGTILLNDMPMLSDQGLSCISQSCPYITRISLHNCPSITDEGLIALGAFCVNLSVVEIAENALITADGIDGLARAAKLEHVSVQRCKRVSDRSLSALSKHPLSYLNFSDNNTITDGGLKLLGLGQGSGSAARAALRSIILRNLFRISDTGIRSLSRGCTSLRELDVSGCARLTDSSISIALSYLPTLSQLSTSRTSGLEGGGGGGKGGYGFN